ncbi:putative monocarboxylate transporter 2 isoform X2 [Apostichopus japonicus]|uniref:Putative monocarboxylate transporter 2 isoform X2 n=1 Tax=Stichopus japonicus TaxID=307972 RepID=A0A2G8JB79_STIJA|nr:putative monocarboxylate transporter 2 isoform X2 [Apostichopus japonicus]
MCFFSTIVSSMMPTITPLFVTFSLLYGFGINFVLISSMNLILKYFPGVNCSRATSVALVGTTAGMLIMSPLIQMMIDSYGWRNMFRVMGAAILLLGVPSCSMYSQPPAKEPTPQVVGFDEGGRPMISAASERENAMKERVIRANEINKEAEKEEAEELNKTTGEHSKENQANTSVTSSRRVSFADNAQTTGEEAKRLLRQQSVTIPEEGDEEDDDEGDDEVMMSQRGN